MFAIFLPISTRRLRRRMDMHSREPKRVWGMLHHRWRWTIPPTSQNRDVGHPADEMWASGVAVFHLSDKDRCVAKVGHPRLIENECDERTRDSGLRNRFGARARGDSGADVRGRLCAR